MGNSGSGDFVHLDATAQADLVRRGGATAIELVDAAIGHIERLNPTLNAVVTPMFEHAREAASGPIPDGPFAGGRSRCPQPGSSDSPLRALE